MNVLLLTCTARVHNKVVVARNNELDRIADYVNAISKWRELNLFDSIVVVDNSGYDFSSHFMNHADSIEFLSFEANGSYDSSLGKGYGEYLILKYATENSKKLMNSSLVFKCTGRYTLKNSQKIVRCCTNSVDVYGDFSRNLSWVDSRFFVANPDFLEFAMSHLSMINEADGIYMEISLARALHAYMAHGKTWNLLPTAPLFQGFYGRDNTRYSENMFKAILKTNLKFIKKIAINIRY